jgi:methionine-rich copper-binding protein CopC
MAKTDKTPPNLDKFTPTNNALAVSLNADLTLTFNEAVKTAKGNVIISDGKGDTRTISITDTNQISVIDNTVKIDPQDNLKPNSTYNVKIGYGAIVDLAGNKYAGISKATTFSFSTIDTLAPYLVSMTPKADSTKVAVNQNLVFNFNEGIKLGTGSISLTNATNAQDVKIIDITDAQQIRVSDKTLTVNPEFDLKANTKYIVNFLGNPIKDLTGNAYQSTTFSLTTGADKSPPLLTQVNTSQDGNLLLVFSEDIVLGKGAVVVTDTTIKNSKSATFNITDAKQVSVLHNVITINPTTDFVVGHTYTIKLGAGIVKDKSNNVYKATSTGSKITVLPAITINDVKMSNDTGINSSDFITNTVKQTIAGTLSAPLSKGDTLQGSLDNGATWVDITSKIEGTQIYWDNALLLNGANNSIAFRVLEITGQSGGLIGKQAYTLDIGVPSTSDTTLLETHGGTVLADGVINATEKKGRLK